MDRRRVLFLLAASLLLAAPSHAALPKALRSRFQEGDPETREILVRPDLQNNFQKVWDTVIEAIDDSHFEIALTDKDSGYVRTTKNRGVVVLKDNWYYELQITAKLVFKYRETGGENTERKDRVVEKVRITVIGEAIRVRKQEQLEYYRGWDRTLTADLFSDLRGKLGSQ